MKRIYISGASFTVGPWFTWANFLEFESNIPVENISTKGQGNESIITRLIQRSPEKDSLVICMLTPVDKFDWYVTDDRFHSLKEEKHPPIELEKNKGYWCTGSWMPKEKELYKNHFYDQDWQVAHNIRLISLLKKDSELKGYKLILTFDSDIWKFTEQEMQKGDKAVKQDLLSGTLAKIWRHHLDDVDRDISDSSMIGYCMKNNLPWFSPVYKCHPPSGSHYKWYKHVLKPMIQDLIPLKDLDWKSKIRTLDIRYDSADF